MKSTAAITTALCAQITTQGPLFLVGTNFEHAGSLEYDVTGAANVIATHVQARMMSSRHPTPSSPSPPLPCAPFYPLHHQTEASVASLVLNGTSLVTVYGTLFGSGVGGGGANHTLTAVRPLGNSPNCVTSVNGTATDRPGAAGGSGSGIDVSYRIHGDMQRRQPQLLVDSGYTVPGDPADWTHTSAYINTCTPLVS